jgi:2-hydroxychromene-2-carboxylate isomerase
MVQDIEYLGGIAGNDPSFFRRWLVSMMIRREASARYRNNRRRKFEKLRVQSAKSHRVEFFFQVEDPYSYLAAQVLQGLLNTYDIELCCHLVSGPSMDTAPESAIVPSSSRRDCAAVAPHYGLAFPAEAKAPRQSQIDQAVRILAAAPDSEFPQLSVTVGRALWSGDLFELKTLATRLGELTKEQAEARMRAGSDRRQELGHFACAMFWYGDEWYWGIDRFYHLENRLAELNLRRGSGRQLLMPRPGIEKGTLQDSGSITLEVYLSLHSPYSAIIFDKAVALARHARVRLVVRPVMPMAFRSTLVTQEEGLYIAFDAAREADSLGVEWGRAYDPVGKPVRQCLALYRWAEYQGKGAVLLSAFMRLAWSQKVNTNSRSGLRKVVEAAGLDWKEAQMNLDNTDWTEFVEANRLALDQQGLGGVPAFRLLDSEQNSLLSVRGADRLWLVARVIQEHLRTHPPLDDF